MSFFSLSSSSAALLLSSWRQCAKCFFILLIVISGSHQAIASRSIASPRPRPIDLKSSLNRIVEIDLENSAERAHSSLLTESLERTLYALQPTLIIASPRLTDEIALSNAQIELFLEVRKRVLATNPRCRFGVTLHVSHYLTAPELLSRLQEITTKLEPEMINMALSPSSEVISPTALSRGIEYAHHHGQLVSYEGPATMIPDGVDAFVMKPLSGELHRDEVSGFKTRHHLPIIVRVPVAARERDTHERLLLKHLAEEQSSFGYHLAYPLQLTSSGNLDTNNDPSLLVMLRALMTRYN
jgi:hypothetical protein